MNAWADNPQAAGSDAVVERAGRLAPAEVKALQVAAARDAAWAAALDAARDAAWDAAWAAALDAALDAAWDAAWAADRDAARGEALAAAWDAAWAAGWAAAWAAARDAGWAAAWAAGWAAGWAAEALVAHDLIDENTPWNQAAYDLLTGLWRRVIGPIHPADEVLS